MKKLPVQFRKTVAKRASQMWVKSDKNKPKMSEAEGMLLVELQSASTSYASLIKVHMYPRLTHE